MVPHGPCLPLQDAARCSRYQAEQLSTSGRSAEISRWVSQHHLPLWMRRKVLMLLLEDSCAFPFSASQGHGRGLTENITTEKGASKLCSSMEWLGTRDPGSDGPGLEGWLPHMLAGCLITLSLSSPCCKMGIIFNNSHLEGSLKTE